MRIAETPHRDDAAHRHAADGDAIEIKEASESRIGKRLNDGIDLGNSLPDHLETGIRLVRPGPRSFAVARQVHRTRGDSGSNPAKKTSGIELFVRGAPVHPEHNRRRSLPVRMSEQRGHIGPEAFHADGRREIAGELLEAVLRMEARHAPKA